MVEKLFDWLRSHNGYGKHMARHWLDLALYANNAGYASNPPWTIWGWCNWVLRAFDADMLIDSIDPTGLLRHVNPTRPQH